MSTISKLLEVIDIATGDASSTFTRICEASWNGVKSYGDVDVTAPFSGFCLQVDVCFFMMLLLQGKIFTCHFTVESQPHQPRSTIAAIPYDKIQEGISVLCEHPRYSLKYNWCHSFCWWIYSQNFVQKSKASTRVSYVESHVFLALHCNKGFYACIDSERRNGLDWS